MDTQLLTAFITVAERHSFSLAADQLGLTQSAISKRIALLEEKLSQPLFDRINRKVFLTEAGTALLPRAKHILDAVEDTQRFMSVQQGKVSGVLRLATSHHIGIHRLPPILKAYTEQYPDVHLQIHFIDSEHAIDAVRHGDYDLAIITLPEIPKDDGSSDIQYHVLWQDTMHFVVNHQHPLLQKKSHKHLHKKREKRTITFKDLSCHPAILPDITTRTTQLVKNLFSQKNLELDISMTTNHLDAIKMMVSVGLGWSALPSTLIDSNIKTLPITGINIARELGCIHHRQRTLSNSARAMLTSLRDHLV